MGRAALRVCPPLVSVPKLVSGLRRRFPATDERVEVALPTGGRMIINPRDYVSYHIYMLGLYEGETVRLLLSKLQPGDTFFDIGGHFGQYAVSAGIKVGPAGRVYTFEPGPVQVEYLRRNIEINALANVTVANLALSDAPGELGLHVPSLVDIGKSQLVDPQADGAVRVPVTTLDAYCEENAIDRIDVMKVDVEGAELGVFRGAKRVMRDFPPKAVFYESVDVLCEAFDHTPAEMHAFLEDCGYKIHTIRNGKLVSVGAGERADLTDFVALR
jgi:FkbM family methyltransferase